MDSNDTFLAKVAASPALSPPKSPHLGTRRFELGRRLGAGAFGEVYEARDRESGAAMAVKVMKATSPDRLFRFKREFRAVADIAHPNLVRLYELVEEDERWYLAMELVSGVTFGEHLRAEPEETRAAFTQLAQAVAALHRAGQVHRDIKPSNVLVERSGRVVLLDFGLALAVGDGADTVIAGTPHYMAPEQLSGHAIGPACDWYAYGVMLYEALAGMLPHDDATDRLAARKRQLPRPPSELREDVAPDLERLALRLLAPRPEERAGADEVLALLAAGDLDSDAGSSAREKEVFAGRSREQRRLHDGFEQVRSRGEGVVVWVEGDAGIGKTSLVRAFEREVVGRGALSFAGRCHEAESVPFKGIDAIVDALSEHLRRRPAIEAAALLPRDALALATMFPVLKRAEAFARTRGRPPPRGPLESRRAAVEALRELLARISDTAPLVVHVDDVMWATDDGLALLESLLAPPTPPALFVLTCRKEARGRGGATDAFVERMQRDPGITWETIALDALSREDVEELVAREPRATVTSDEAFLGTGGHPFLLSRLLRSEGAREAASSVAGALDPELDRLGAEARRVLDVLSVAGTSLSQGAACEIAGLDGFLPRAIDELRTAKLVRSSGRSARADVEPYHDQIRERVVARLSPGSQVSLHRQLAEALAGRGRGDAEAIARHWAGAGDRAQAVTWLRQAAEGAIASLAFARAAELLGRAASLVDEDGARVDLLVEQANALAIAGRRVDAGRACLAACEIAKGPRIAELRALAGEHYMLGGDFRRGADLLREGLAAVGVVLPTSAGVAVAESLNKQVEIVVRGLSFRPRDGSDVSPATARRIDLQLAAARALAQTDIRAPWLSATALLDALELGEPRRVLYALGMFAFANAARLAEHPLTEEVLARAEQLGRELEDDTGLAWAVMARACACLYRREVEASMRLFKDAERRFLALARPALREAGVARIGIVTNCASHGYDLPFARERTKVWLEEALAREDMTPATWLRVLGAWIDLAADKPADARRSLQLAREAWTDVEDEIFTAAAVLAELAITLYDTPASAWNESERLGTVFLRTFASMLPVPRLSFYRQRAAAALCAHRAGDADRRTTSLRVEACLEAIEGIASAVDTIALLRAHLAFLAGDPAKAADLFDRAANGFDTHRQGTHALLARLRAGEARRTPTDELSTRLVAMGVDDPERYGVLFAGPSVRW